MTGHAAFAEMASIMDSTDGAEDRRLPESHAAWDDLIQAVGPASLLVVIEARASHALKQRYSSEDILQDALLHAWRDRRQCEWRGLKSFRSWLLAIIDHRIHEAVVYEGAAKRGGGQTPVLTSFRDSSTSASQPPSSPDEPVISTTPSRVAMFREQADAMRAALETLSLDLREVVRLRLFEQRSILEIAEQLGIGESAVRHRFRKGTTLYQATLRTELMSRSLPSSMGAARIP